MSRSDEEGGRETRPWTAPQYGRRLSDKILIAFHHACEHKDLEVAERLLHVLEMMLARRSDPVVPDRRRQQNRETLAAAHEHLWRLRHPDQDDDVERASDK